MSKIFKDSLLCKDERKILLDYCQNMLKSNTNVNPCLPKIYKSLFVLNVLSEQYRDLNKNFIMYSPNTLNAANFFCLQSIKALGFKCDHPNVVIAKKDSDFDYTCTDAMKLSKFISDKKEQYSSHDMAVKLSNGICENDIFCQTEISNPGFINFKMKIRYLENFVEDLILFGPRPPFIPKKKVCVDFSSPNIAKEMHVGHLRSTIIGECICRVLEFVGFEVLRISHVGDWGTQFGMLIAHLEDNYPNFDTCLPEISDLQAFYQASKKRFDSDEAFKSRSHERVVALQSGKDEKVTLAWKAICSLSRAAFMKIYDRLDVKVIERGESFYQEMMVNLVQELDNSGVLKNENGCKVAHVPGFKVPLMVVKSDGGFTYDTSDIATIWHRLKIDKCDWILYVVDSGQRDHLQTIFNFATELGWYHPIVTRVEHIEFGVVLSEGGKKLKTRSGESIKLVELLDESVLRCRSILSARGLEDKFESDEVSKICEAVGYSCVKYADLSHNMVSDYEFSFDRMLDTRGDTAVYLLYCYTRIRSIIRKTQISEDVIVKYVASDGIKGESVYDIKLMRKLVHFPEVIYKVVYQTFPNYICEYIYELARILTEFYENCQIINLIDKKPNMNRLALIYSGSLVLKKCFELIGITPLERM